MRFQNSRARTQKATDFETFLKFKPTDYQAKLLEDNKKRIIVMWPHRKTSGNPSQPEALFRVLDTAS